MITKLFHQIFVLNKLSSGATKILHLGTLSKDTYLRFMAGGFVGCQILTLTFSWAV